MADSLKSTIFSTDGCIARAKEAIMHAEMELFHLKGIHEELEELWDRAEDLKAEFDAWYWNRHKS